MYYYDQAGALTRTVPPAGVKLLTPAQTAQVNAYRTQTNPTPVYPTHARSTNTMVTNYVYNSLNQLKESATPDGGTSRFWYDKVGRLLASQNGRQAAIGGVYSYTLYDKQNRPYEVGELQTTTPMTQVIADDYSVQYLNWVTGAIQRTEVTKTYYDQASTAAAGTPFAGGQQYLRQRVATVTTEETYDGNDATYNHATHYSYDVHGNVNELVQDNPELDHLGGQAFSQRYKRMTYSYELVSGNVKEVNYQQGEGDMYVHRYSYDADNRVMGAFTSKNGIVWSRDAKYQYYLHGPLGRTELGEKQVQGTDYVYTIQGWIKGVNSNVLDRDKDIGKDGHNTNATNYIATQQGIHSNVATDAFGFTLDFFWNNSTNSKDYKPINAAAQTLYNDAPNATSGINDLYNGNIKGMAVALQKPNGAALPQNLSLQYNQYKYDQLNRITLHQAYTGASTSAYASLTNTNEYRNVFSYDANGNIITQLRNGTTAAGQSMDNLQYNYYTNTGSTYNPAAATPTNATNKLAYVDDSGTPANYADDLEDQASGNYAYDATGQLISDAAEQVANIGWTIYGKIKTVRRTSGSTKKELNFRYDALGQRVVKLAKDRDAALGVKTQENWTYTYYVRDAQGNVMATYKRTLTAGSGSATEKLALEESHVYGSSRLGIYDREAENINASNTFPWGGNYTPEGELDPAGTVTQTKMAAPNLQTPTRKLGQKLYELSNHLGNVLVTVSDRKLTKQLGTSAVVEYYMADVRSTSDFSAFGAPLSGRTFSSPNYKYGFNGMEKDQEMHGNDGDSYDFGARMLDVRLGRWLSVDEQSNRGPAFSPYNAFLNSPVLLIDPDGNWIEVSVKKYYKDKNGNYIEKTTWRDNFRRTVRIEKNVTVHDAKLLYDAANPPSQDALKLIAESMQRDIIDTWSTNGEYIQSPNGRGPELKVDVVFDGGIQVVNDLSQVKEGDELIVVTSKEVIMDAAGPEAVVKIANGGHADATVLGSIILIRPYHAYPENEKSKANATVSRSDLISTLSHEWGHRSGKSDNRDANTAMDNSLPTKPTYFERKAIFDRKETHKGVSKKDLNRLNKIKEKHK